MCRIKGDIVQSLVCLEAGVHGCSHGGWISLPTSGKACYQVFVAWHKDWDGVPPAYTELHTRPKTRLNFRSCMREIGSTFTSMNTDKLVYWFGSIACARKGVVKPLNSSMLASAINTNMVDTLLSEELRFTSCVLPGL